MGGTTRLRDWNAADEQRLRRLVAGMRPYATILAEFPDNHANDVCCALERVVGPIASPCERALHVLGHRGAANRLSPTGLSLDGRPASAAQLVAAANAVLRTYGAPLISYPGVAAE